MPDSIYAPGNSGSGSSGGVSGLTKVAVAGVVTGDGTASNPLKVGMDNKTIVGANSQLVANQTAFGQRYADFELRGAALAGLGSGIVLLTESANIILQSACIMSHVDKPWATVVQGTIFKFLYGSGEVTGFESDINQAKAMLGAAGDLVLPVGIIAKAPPVQITADNKIKLLLNATQFTDPGTSYLKVCLWYSTYAWPTGNW